MNPVSRRNPWPLWLLLLGAFFLTLTAWSVYRASTRGSAVTDPGYYSHGLRFNDSLLERQAAEGLGWSVATAVQDGWIRVRLSGRDGLPVAGGAGEVVIFRVRTGSETRLVLHELSPGEYGAPLPGGLRGEFPAEMSLGRDGARVSRRLQLNL
ncbi:hypothetical protein DESUT3_04830 [Desulfuromonas versatilis]|uniref:FixH family protein n=1 Tax=Desulfuromonas versatilis TaxID=2802975 RepID=A0ABN6DV80_9BACT|nr:FixH family protein [Desulfuromonas versatilis]BCR03414.1 hypothetical protein DESUT3_04830 [Desulfuromonas versatilis]